MISTKREVPCCICQGPVAIESRTTDEPEAPEMLRSSDSGVWLGMVMGDNGGEVIVTCGDDCLVKLFAQVFQIEDDVEKVDTLPAPPAE